MDALDTREMTPTPRPASPLTTPKAGSSTPANTVAIRKSISVDVLNAKSESQERLSSSSSSRPYTTGRPLRSNTLDPAIDPMWNYDFPGADDQFFKKLASGELDEGLILASNSNDTLRSGGEEDTEPLDDSDLDRQNGMSKLKAARAKDKGKAKSTRAPVPPGELLLPSRAPTLSNASSVSSTSSAPRRPSVPLPIPPLPSSGQKRSHVPAPILLPEGRSGNTTVNHTPMPRLGVMSDSHDFVIAIIGAARCGKSTLIRKGFKWWDVGPGEPSSVTVSGIEAKVMRYSVSVKISGRVRTVKILEIDSVLLDGPPSTGWPDAFEPIDGALVCYDQTVPNSTSHVVDIMKRMRAIRPLVGVILVGCKTDLQSELPVQLYSDASDLNIGLVQVMNKNSRSESDKEVTKSQSEKTRQCCYWLLLAINRYRRGDQSGTTNPASPEVLQQLRTMPNSPPHRTRPVSSTLPESTTSHPRSPSIPTSPTRARSTNDLLSPSKSEISDGSPSQSNLGARPSAASLNATGADSSQPLSDDNKDVKKEIPPLQWATLDHLLDKVFFLAVSGDDKTFVQYFFLTYRRFATPRSVLLGMQKRMRQLAQAELDPLLAKFAQMKICNLLDQWVNDYPCDFATPGTPGALSAVLKQMITHVHTAHYGSDLYPFLEELPTLADEETSWCIKTDQAKEESDDEVGLDEDDVLPIRREPLVDRSPGGNRDRKPSMLSNLRPPSGRQTFPLLPSVSGMVGPDATPTSKPNYKELLRTANIVANLEPTHLAEEITRIELNLFWAIEPRHWLRHTMAKERLPDDPISRFAKFYNYLSRWTTSLILAHDKPRNRAKLMERFAYVARALRQLNNYSGLRAVVTGINNARVDGCPVSEIVKSKQIWKIFQSLEVLLGSTRMHGAYRMALRHTVGPAIPEMEIHTVDLFRSHESNPDFKADDPEKIHWGKFALLGKLIANVTLFQDRTRTTEYEPPERLAIYDLVVNTAVMDESTIGARAEPPSGKREQSARLPGGLPFPTQPVPQEIPSSKPSVFRRPGRFFFGNRES